MAQISLSVDTSQAMNALNGVNNAITQIRLNGSQIDVGKVINGPKQQFDQMKNDAKNATQTITNVTNETSSNSINKIKGVTKQFKQSLGAVKNFATGMVSVWTGVIAVIEVAIKTVTYFWNNLTESVSKLTTRGQNAIKVAQLNKKKVQQETKAAKDLISKLEELNKAEKLNVDQQRLAESIVAKLNKQYKDLSITLDSTTGKYNGLYEAQIKLDRRNKNAQANALNNEILAQRDVINAALKTAFGSEINIGKNVTGNEFFTLAQRIGGTLGTQNADLLAKKWNTKDIQQQLEVIDQLIGGLSSGDQFMQTATAVRDAMQTLVDYKKQLQDLNSIDTQIIDTEKRLTDAFKSQRDALKATREQTEKLNKSIAEQNKQNYMSGLDPEQRANLLRGEVELLKKKNKQLLQTQQLKDEQTRYINLEANSDRWGLDSTNQKRKDAEKRIIDLKAQIDESIRQQNKYRQKYEDFEIHSGVRDPEILNAELAQRQKLRDKELEYYGKEKVLQTQLVKAQKQLNTLNQDAQKYQVALYQSQQKRLQHLQQLAQLEKNRTENLAAIQAKEKQIADIEAQIAKERADAELKAWQLEQQRIKNYGDFVNDLQRKQIEGLNEILGKKKDNLLLELQLNAEKVRGRKLTEEQLEALKSYVNVMTAQDQFKSNMKLNLDKNPVITNDLARKGGWASSVVVDRSGDINKQILDVQKSQVDLMNKLNDTMKKSNELLQKYSVIQ